jgi:exportin-1
VRQLAEKVRFDHQIVSIASNEYAVRPWIGAVGVIATKTPKVRSLRTIKKEVLKLVDTYVRKTEDLEAVNTNLMPALFEAILEDYNRNTAAARDAEVLNVMTTITSRLGVRSPMFTSLLGPDARDID